MNIRPDARCLAANRAFAFVELLVVTAALGMLLMLLLPALQAAREATRNSQCKHHLRAIAFACLKHEDARHVFPYSGWSFGWMGDPDQGIGPQQPGSWIYTSGRYLESDADFDTGAGLPWAQKRAALASLLSTVIPEYYCPSRRPAMALPSRSRDGISCDNGVLLKNAELPKAVAKSDYAINGGSGGGWDGGAGGTGGAPYEDCLRPSELNAGPGYPNCSWHISNSAEYWQRFNGVSGWRIGAQSGQISDGVSKTILVGEKFIQPMFYEDSCPRNGFEPSKGNAGDNGAMYLGWDIDIARTGKLARDFNAASLNTADNSQFGSAHPHAANFSFCDGSVRSIRYDIANFVRFVTRNDSDLPSF